MGVALKNERRKERKRKEGRKGQRREGGREGKREGSRKDLRPAFRFSKIMILRTENRNVRESCYSKVGDSHYTDT